MKQLHDWLALLTRRHHQAVDLGLQRCGEVYRRLGSPRPARQVVSVAGTNGKGSTVAYLAALSAALEQRCGTYTSPHILRFNERICVQGEPVADDCLVAAFARVEAARGAVSLTYFEFTTLAAFIILQQADLDCAILEVGLGGRLDAVNLVDADCMVITAIGLDHQDYLGPDIASIATEKAGIMRPATAVVCAERQPPEVILQIAADLKAPLWRAETDFRIAPVRGQEAGLLRFSMGAVNLEIAAPRMRGQHQLDNLAGSLAAFLLLNPEAGAAMEEISAAIHQCELPGRLQTIHAAPTILLDVGHNTLAAEALAAHLRRTGAVNTTCVLAMLADKPVEAVARVLAPVCQHWLCLDSQGSRGQRGTRLAQRIHAVLPAAGVKSCSGFAVAIDCAIQQAGASGHVLVFGSFSIVADATRWLRTGLQHPAHDAARIS